MILNSRERLAIAGVIEIAVLRQLNEMENTPLTNEHRHYIASALAMAAETELDICLTYIENQDRAARTKP